MNEEWAVKRLKQWVNTATPARSIFDNYGAREYLSWANKDSAHMDSLRENEDQVSRIIQRVLNLPKQPSLLVALDSDNVEVQQGIDLAKRSLGRIQTRAETAANLGNNAPTMRADALHPLIWGAASKRWEGGHYSDAIQRAATALSGLVKDQTGRYELGDNDLMTQAFSLAAPQVGKPRLRWPGNDDDLTVKSMRQGILSMTQGVFSAIRNPATHTTDELPKQEALEQLATLSVLARWIDCCELVTV